MSEPIYDSTIRSTETSKAEGRLKEGILHKKRKALKKILKDGKGGPGVKKINLSSKEIAKLASYGIKQAVAGSKNYDIPGGVSPVTIGKLKKPKFSGIASGINKLLKKNKVRKLVLKSIKLKGGKISKPKKVSSLKSSKVNYKVK